MRRIIEFVGRDAFQNTASIGHLLVEIGEGEFGEPHHFVSPTFLINAMKRGSSRSVASEGSTLSHTADSERSLYTCSRFFISSSFFFKAGGKKHKKKERGGRAAGAR